MLLILTKQKNKDYKLITINKQIKRKEIIKNSG